MPVRPNSKKPYEDNLAKFTIREKSVTARQILKRCASGTWPPLSPRGTNIVVLIVVIAPHRSRPAIKSYARLPKLHPEIDAKSLAITAGYEADAKKTAERQIYVAGMRLSALLAKLYP